MFLKRRERKQNWVSTATNLHVVHVHVHAWDEVLMFAAVSLLQMVEGLKRFKLDHPPSLVKWDTPLPDWPTSGPKAPPAHVSPEVQTSCHQKIIPLKKNFL